MSEEKLNLKLVSAIFALVIAVMLAGVAYPRGPFVLVVGAPGTSEARMMQIVSDAGGQFASGSRFGWMVVAEGGNGFVTRLMRSGAMLVLDHGLAVGCTKGNLT